MDDLINRADLRNDLTESVVFTSRVNNSAEMRGARKIIERIEAAPAIDAVPVVRCGKCKQHENEEPGMVYCPHIVGGWVSENFFCGFGERKDGEG